MFNHRDQSSPGGPYRGRGRRHSSSTPPLDLGFYGSSPEEEGDDENWPSVYVDLLRERLLLARMASGRLPTGDNLLSRILPIIHSMAFWLGCAGISRWLLESGNVHLTEHQVRSALRRADSFWPDLWAEIRVPVLTLACVHRVRMDVILWVPGAFQALPGWSPGMMARTPRGSFPVPREGLEEMHRLLLRRWIMLAPHTRDCARRYMGQVVDVLHQDYGLPG